jgi:hypothetical protein
MNDYNIAIIIALAVSMILNIGLLWYNRKLIGKLLFISNNLNDLVSMVESYRAHLKVLYSTEMYYGDETMKHLIAHTNSLSDLLEDYEDITYLTEPIEIGPQQEEEDFEKNEKNENPGQDVFYGGTRESNN